MFPRASWLYRELGFLEYLDHNIRQTKKGKVYTNPFHRTTARRKGRDHSHETVESVQLPGLRDNCSTFVSQRQNAKTFVFCCIKSTAITLSFHFFHDELQYHQTNCNKTWASTFFMTNCNWWSLGAYFTVRPKQRWTFPYKVWVGNTYGIGSLSACRFTLQIGL